MEVVAPEGRPLCQIMNGSASVSRKQKQYYFLKKFINKIGQSEALEGGKKDLEGTTLKIIKKRNNVCLFVVLFIGQGVKDQCFVLSFRG